MTALAVALGWLGALAFVAFVVWLRAQRPAEADPQVRLLIDDTIALKGRLAKAEETLSTHSLALGLGPRRTPEKRA